MPVHLVYRIVFRHLQPASAVMLTLVVIPLLLSIRAIPLAAAPARQPHLGLVAAYAFDEGAGATTADASGQGHIGALFGIFRFLFLLYQKSDAASPTEAILRDPPFLVNIALWGATVLVLIYGI